MSKKIGVRSAADSLLQSIELAVAAVALGADGAYEVAQRLQQERGDKPLLLIAVTGYGQGQDRSRSLAVGFKDHIVKPIVTLRRPIPSRY